MRGFLVKKMRKSRNAKKVRELRSYGVKSQKLVDCLRTNSAKYEFSSRQNS